jgi:hypothetical protein
MNRLLWAGAIALAGFELWAASLMLSPQVSANYRDYYVSGVTDCWPRAVSGRYRLGQPLSFRDDPVGRSTVRHRQCGWIAPFSAGSWSVGDRAQLRFAFDVPETGLVIGLVAQGYIGTDHREQRVEMRVNDVRLNDLVFTPTSQGFAAVPVSADVAALDPDGVTIRFDFPDRISPLAMGVNNDRRELGILLSELMISALPQ